MPFFRHIISRPFLPVFRNHKSTFNLSSFMQKAELKSIRCYFKNVPSLKNAQNKYVHTYIQTYILKPRNLACTCVCTAGLIYWPKTPQGSFHHDDKCVQLCSTHPGCMRDNKFDLLDDIYMYNPKRTDGLILKRQHDINRGEGGLNNVNAGWQRETRFQFYTSGNHPYLSTLMGLNASVFALWRYTFSTNNSKFIQMMMNHFVCNPNNLIHSRWHSALFAGFSHMTLTHFLVNFLCLDILIRNLSNYLTEKEITSIYILSAILGSLSNVILLKSSVLGASAAVLGLIFVNSCIDPRAQYMMLFPLPGLTLSSLQLTQMALFFDSLMTSLMLMGINIFGGVAWVGHLFGMLGGAMYSVYKQQIQKDQRFYSFTALCRRYTISDWRRSYLGMLQYFKS